MKRNRFSSSKGSSSEADSPLTEQLVKPQLEQSCLLSGVTNMTEADTSDMHNGEDNQEIAKDIGFIEIAYLPTVTHFA